MNNGVVRDRDNKFSRHQTFKDGVTIEGGLTVDITGGSNAEETADFTAEAGKVYVVDTSSSAVTATLPASPTALEEVTFLDGAKTFNSNALTVNTNGKKLDGATVATKVHTTKGGAFKYIYRNATYGWLLKAFIFMLFALNAHAGDFTYEMNSWEQDSGLSIGTDKLKPRTAGSLLSISDSAGTTVATITTSAMTITTASITDFTATTGCISTLDSSTSQIGTLSLTNALTVSNGGTGLTTLAAGRVPYGADSSPLASDDNFVYSSAKLGIGTTAPAKKLEVLDTAGAQARLSYTAGSAYADFTVNAGGDLSISPTGIFTAHNFSAFKDNSYVGYQYPSFSVGGLFSLIRGGGYAPSSGTRGGLMLSGGHQDGVTGRHSGMMLSAEYASSVLHKLHISTVNPTGGTTSAELIDRITVLSTGNMGIGTTAPAKKLEVLDTAGAQARLSYTAGSAYADFTVDAAGDLTIAPSGTKTTFTTVAISGDYLASTGAAGITTEVTAGGIVFRFVSGLLTAINP